MRVFRTRSSPPRESRSARLSTGRAGSAAGASVWVRECHRRPWRRKLPTSGIASEPTNTSLHVDILLRCVPAGTSGAEAVARPAPDGSSLLMDSNTARRRARAKDGLPSAHELRADSLSGRCPVVITVNAAPPYRKLADLIDTAWRQASRDNVCHFRPRRAFPKVGFGLR